MSTIEEGIYQDRYGFYCRVTIGSGRTARRARKRFPPNASLAKMRTWRLRQLARFQDQPAAAERGTLSSDVLEYLRTADITAATKARRTQQLAWWCAQPVAPGAEVLSLKQVKMEAEAARRGDEVPQRRTFGELPRTALDPKRLREILQNAFASPNADDPTIGASTSNSYRTALFHFFTTLDADDPLAVNPLTRVKVRPQKGAQLSGQDARIVAEILKHVPSKFGRDGHLSEVRLAVLAWVHITPQQLMGLDPRTAFHDVPDATREDILAGAITLTKRPRLKGRKGKPIPAPETIPLNPWGVEAMRRFLATPAAWAVVDDDGTPIKLRRTFSLSPLNKMFKRACTRAQAALAKDGITVDLSAMTLYHLKHSLATTASIASAGLVNRQGVIQQSPGVQRALDHAGAKTTTIYTQAAVDPIVRAVNTATSLYLEHLFTVPLSQPAPLRLVKG